MDPPVAEDTRTSTKVDLTPTQPLNGLPATVSVSAHGAGPWTVVVVEGEMDFQVIQLLANLPEHEAACVVFDLRGVTFMDAGGLGVIISSQQKARQAGGSVRLVAPSVWVLRILTLTGTDNAFRSFPSLEEAISASVGINATRAL